MKKLPVPYLDQTAQAPTGCESVSAVMLLRYLGYDVTIDSFLDTALDKGVWEQRGGEWWGSDPREAFVGDPRDPEALGCYAPVMVKALNRVAGDTYTAVDETGTEIDDLCLRYIDAGIPVLLWCSINMRPTVNGPWYRLIPSGEPFMWVSNEHCLLLVGYDAENYICNDPWDNNGVVSYPRRTVWQRHREQGMQAVGLWKT